MARIFTIDFEFEGINHAAIVSTWKEEVQNGFYKIVLHDETLQQLFPDGVVAFPIKDMAPLVLPTRRDELLQCLKKAINRHLNGTLQ